jgi:hypothetical protein
MTPLEMTQSAKISKPLGEGASHFEIKLTVLRVARHRLAHDLHLLV